MHNNREGELKMQPLELIVDGVRLFGAGTFEDTEPVAQSIAEKLRGKWQPENFTDETVKQKIADAMYRALVQNRGGQEPEERSITAWKNEANKNAQRFIDNLIKHLQ